MNTRKPITNTAALALLFSGLLAGCAITVIVLIAVDAPGVMKWVL